ncbi:UAA transporter [Pleurotus eryngii]|uniref:UAA transporter n=1 Tax=Pleurotus eryngii TaxID=5323 RepID=A0A9P6A1K0_PLEER|nr:UAA transporter [Pleurotus eryngii]
MDLLTDWAPSLALVFGGCCSNAITLEQVTSVTPTAGSAITLLQFVFITLHGLPSHLNWTPYGPRLRPRVIGLPPYIAQVFLFYSISLINNAAFAFKIPMAVHIIFRSGGLIVSMLMGWLISGKRYTPIQVFSVILVSLGVILTTLSASPASRKVTASEASADLRTYLTGIALLSAALLLSGFLGLVQEWTYARHFNRPSTGKGDKTASSETWKEAMFYLHFLSLPMFIFLRSDLSAQFTAIHSLAQKSPLVPLVPFSPLNPVIPSIYLSLAVNTITQVICIAGVNRLTTRVNALTVTLILVVRKAVSLIISVLGVQLIHSHPGGKVMNVDGVKMWSGALLVMLGTVGYSVGSRKSKSKAKADKDKSD